MGWIHDTGYAPAYDHVGSVATVLADGTEARGISTAIEPDVIGWRAACACGWRGVQFFARAEWPSRSGRPPEHVDGCRAGTGAFVEWEQHVARVIPALAVHDLAQHLAEIEGQMRKAVRKARLSGLSWAHIAAAAGTTAHHASLAWGPMALPSAQQPPV